LGVIRCTFTVRPFARAQPHQFPALFPDTAAVGERNRSIQDELQLSDAGQLVDKVRDLPEIRQDRVDQIKAQIATGAYETEEKLNIAVAGFSTR